MSEKSDRERLRKEAKSYGMRPDRGLTSRQLDSVIQDKVGRDFDNNICSACGNRLHGGNC